jgi:radical SAM protein with 4Fe4S-binding SPASM domain
MGCDDCSEALASATAEDFFRKVNERNVPLSATLELTYRCNFHCVHCYCVVDGARTPDELTTAEWKGVLDQLAAAGTLSVSFTGGDPFLRKDAWDIAEHAKARRFALRFLTNASFFNDANADRLAALKPASVSISLYGATPETYERVTGRADFHAKAFAGIQRLADRGVRLQIKLPLLRESFHERREMIEIARKFGATSIRVDAEIGPKDDGDVSPLAHALDDEQLAAFVREFRGPLPVKPRFAPEDRLCRPGASSFAIGPYGDLYPCMQIKRSMGNLRERSFPDLWATSEPLADVRALRAGDFDGCNACSHFGPCKPCPGTSQTLAGSLTAPTPTHCRTTEFRSRLPVIA